MTLEIFKKELSEESYVTFKFSFGNNYSGFINIPIDKESFYSVITQTTKITNIEPLEFETGRIYQLVGYDTIEYCDSYIEKLNNYIKEKNSIFMLNEHEICIKIQIIKITAPGNFGDVANSNFKKINMNIIKDFIYNSANNEYVDVSGIDLKTQKELLSLWSGKDTVH